MLAALPLRLEELTAKHLISGLEKSGTSSALPLGIEALDDALPDGGLPVGSVVELCAPMGLARSTHLALSLCAAGQQGNRDWMAWVDPSDSLFAPSMVAAGVDLSRLLVVRPTDKVVARTAVRLATSRLFRVIVIDRSGLPGASVMSRARWSTVVRRLALAAESSETTIVIVSSTERAHRDLLPTAMRVELTRPDSNHLRLHVTKDRRGRLPGPVSVRVSELAARRRVDGAPSRAHADDNRGAA